MQDNAAHGVLYYENSVLSFCNEGSHKFQGKGPLLTKKGGKNLRYNVSTTPVYKKSIYVSLISPVVFVFISYAYTTHV